MPIDMSAVAFATLLGAVILFAVGLAMLSEIVVRRSSSKRTKSVLTTADAGNVARRLPMRLRARAARYPTQPW